MRANRKKTMSDKDFFKPPATDVDPESFLSDNDITEDGWLGAAAGIAVVLLFIGAVLWGGVL